MISPSVGVIQPARAHSLHGVLGNPQARQHVPRLVVFARREQVNHCGRTLVRYHVLFAIELATRRIQILGIIPETYGSWMEQIARNATDGVDGFLLGKRYLITDRDPRQL
jgi:hypothetical protein